MEKPDAEIISKSIRAIGIGFLILCVGIGVNKVAGQVDIGVIISFAGFAIVSVGILMGGFAVIKSWFS